MIVVDELSGPDPLAAPPPTDDRGPRRRWPVYLLLACVLFATLLGIVLFGIDNASAAGGCGGG